VLLFHGIKEKAPRKSWCLFSNRKDLEEIRKLMAAIDTLTTSVTALTAGVVALTAAVDGTVANPATDAAVLAQAALVDTATVAVAAQTARLVPAPPVPKPVA
jgi:hypothetical protein